jgi:N-acetylmuramoyl-L-alanine amidase
MEKVVTCPNCKTEFDMSIKPHKSESKYLWILDNGHGGVIDGVYQTPGKRSPVWPDGEVLYEGEFNRAIVDRLIKMCESNNIDYVNLVDTPRDIGLPERVRTANGLAKSSEKPCIYVSIHANGYTDESADGWCVYTSIGETKSDSIATVLYEKADAEFPERRMRPDTYRDGDVDQESNFYVLANTTMPAILSENFFMTNYRECHEILMSESGRDRVAKIHFQMIQQLENG